MAESAGARVTRKPDIRRSWTPAEVFAEQVSLIRKRRGWTQAQLAQEMTDRGLAMQQSTIAAVELGKRQVTIDELFTFALALGVAPMALSLPTDSRKRMIFGDRDLLTIPDVAMWWRGDAPLRGGLPPGTGAAINVRTYFDTLPDWLAQLHRQSPEAAELFDLVASITTARLSAPSGSDDTEEAIVEAEMRGLRRRLLELAGRVSATPSE